ncbi:hypothetical protein C1H46_030626 [Malus baccata]|uniref:Uncharacterized protein n=1 Tax=Malus baccata TaxID=106549 RepID=A0A540LBG0_MALBA|nr:hypothetical protein C1H46_030626 [Malus baccata]
MNNSTKLRYLANNPWMNTLDEQSLFDPVKQAEQGWCDNPGTVTEVRAKLQMRQRGNIKRERAIAYSSQQVKVRRNNVTTRVSTRPRIANPITRSFSAPSSDSVQDDTSGSNSSTFSTLVLGNYLKVENVEEANVGKQRTSNCSNIQRHPIEEYHYHNKLMGFFNDDTRSNDDSICILQ